MVAKASRVSSTGTAPLVSWYVALSAQGLVKLSLSTRDMDQIQISFVNQDSYPCELLLLSLPVRGRDPQPPSVPRGGILSTEGKTKSHQSRYLCVAGCGVQGWSERSGTC